jgi:hypothetical protein
MVKIKDIRERLIKNPGEYIEMKLTVAKRTLALFLFLYYLSLLFTIGGFSFLFVSLDILSSLTFHLYSVLVIVMAWFIFSLVEYGQNIYAPEKSWLKIFGLVFAAAFGLFGLVWHFLPHI